MATPAPARDAGRGGTLPGRQHRQWRGQPSMGWTAIKSLAPRATLPRIAFPPLAPDLFGAIPDSRTPSQSAERSENRVLYSKAAWIGHVDCCIELGFPKEPHRLVVAEPTVPSEQVKQDGGAPVDVGLAKFS